jgi:hypothetical protein
MFGMMTLAGLMLAAGGFGADAAGAGLLFVGDFERRGLDPYGDSGIERTLTKARLVESPVRSGRRALELTLARTGADGKPDHRTDFWIRGMSKHFQMGQVYWYGFSVRFPGDWEPDTQAELFVQWIGGAGGAPPLAIYVRGDAYHITKRWGAGDDAAKVLWTGPVTPDRDKWVDWVFQVRWSNGPDGFVRVWKDGQAVADDAGPNMSPAELAPYFKFGIYKWPWKGSEKDAPSKVTRRTLYFDEIRIGDASADRKAVSPPR